MGNKNVAEIDSQRIGEITTEANGQFTKEFSTSFKDAIVNSIKKAYTQQGAVPQALLQAEVPNKDVKTGFLIKMGANVRSWKRRYFVAHNQADNFVISYSEDTGNGTMIEKGKFYCWGYEVEAFNTEEIGKYGRYGIKLTPRDEAKRQWLLKAESEGDQAEWMEVFVNACKKSQPDPKRDAVLAEAFRVAYRNTRTSYGYFGVFHVAGTECEMLEYLTNQILSREVLENYFMESATSRHTSIAARKSKVQHMNNLVQKIVRPIVASCWQGCASTAEGTRASFELSVKASLRTLLEKEQEIKSFLQLRIRALVDPHVPDFQTKTCLPILKCCFEDIVQAYEQALVGFHTEVKTITGSVKYYDDTIDAAFSVLRESVEQVHASPLGGAQKILWKLHTQDLESVYDILEAAGVSGYDVYINTMSDLRQLLQNALYTFIHMARPKNKIQGARDAARRLSSKVAAGTAATTASGSDPEHLSNKYSAAVAGDSKSLSPPPPPAAAAAAAAVLPPSSGSSSRGTALDSDVGAPSAQNDNRDAASMPPPLLVEVLNEVISKLNADAKVSLQTRLASLLVDALEATVQENIIAPSYEVVIPAQSLITKEMQLMINLNSVGENMVREMVQLYINALIEDLVAEASSRLNMVAVQLLNDVSAK